MVAFTDERSRPPVLGVHAVVAVADMPAFFQKAMGAAWEGMARAGAAPAGPPAAVYRSTGPEQDRFEVTAGFPVAQAPESVPEGLTLLPLPAGPAAEEVHVGTYDTLRMTYDEVFAEIARRGLEPADLMWEEYLTDPGAGVPPEQWRTKVVVPLRGHAR